MLLPKENLVSQESPRTAKKVPKKVAVSLQKAFKKGIRFLRTSSLVENDHRMNTEVVLKISKMSSNKVFQQWHKNDPELAPKFIHLRGRQNANKRTENGSNMLTRWSQEEPRRSKMAPRRPGMR